MKKTIVYIFIFFFLIVFYFTNFNIKNDNLYIFEKNKKKNIIPYKIKYFQFKRSEIKEIKENKFKLEKFNNSYLKSNGPRSYLEYYNGNLFLLSADGILMSVSKINLNKKNIVMKVIKSNIRNLIGNNFIKSSKDIINDILIKDNKLYISYQKKNNDNCYTNAVLEGNLNTYKMSFKEFFNTNECQKNLSLSAGGRLSAYKKNNIIMTIGDWESYEKFKNKDVENVNKIVGKIILINQDTKKFKILSMGHRNPQGLFYDEENNFIFLTEHGPQGGDEININTSPDSKIIKNYGWGKASYGEHYGYPEKKNLDLYAIAPLHKSHKKYGFLEPLKYFTPSIAISQIVKTEKFTNEKYDHIIYVGALGYPLQINEGDMSIHQIFINKKMKIKKHNIILINERIRDMIYIKELNKIVLYLETSGSIGILHSIN
jgi:glucose/arabinose dehydrogenase